MDSLQLSSPSLSLPLSLSLLHGCGSIPTTKIKSDRGLNRITVRQVPNESKEGVQDDGYTHANVYDASGVLWGLHLILKWQYLEEKKERGGMTK